MDNTKNYTYENLKNDFLQVPQDSRICLRVRFDAKESDELVVKKVGQCADRGIGFIIPDITDKGFDYLHPMGWLRTYALILDAAEKHGIKVALCLGGYIESAVVRYFDDEEESIRSNVLLKREYYCSREEKVKIPLGEEVMSVVAVEEHGELVDLRSFAESGELIWQAPHGNWKVCRYFCAEDDEQDRVNLLNYDACMKYLNAVLELIRTSLGGYIGKTLNAIAFSDICFSARNRRNWDEGYNALFARINGFDPSPYYPCLYDCTEDSQLRYKAMLMDCRAKMLENGIMKALADTAEREGMILLGALTEPQMSAGSAVTGDAMLVQACAPCGKLEKAYLYGINSIKIASGAAMMSGGKRVACEAFGDYEKLTNDIIYRETATAFARGIDFMIAELPAEFENMKEYAEYAGRLSSVLCGGEAYEDIAVLYPIYSIHSRVSLYDVPIPDGHFEYPETPDITDYMTVINSVTSYAGHDMAVVHPQILPQVLKNGKFKVLVIPATEVISVESMRAAAAFFDGGGKILGTGVLPKHAFEIPEDGGDDFDREVTALVEYIFGDGAKDENITCDYIYHKNDGGGEAYFLYSTFTGVDRCNIVPGSKIAEALASFDISYDVYITDMPRMESTGALNANFPEYCLLGLSSSIRGGGMLNYIHKRRGDNDIYFFSNATDVDYRGKTLIRGKHSFEKWDPISGEISDVDFSFVDRGREDYTAIDLRIDSGKSIILVAK